MACFVGKPFAGFVAGIVCRQRTLLVERQPFLCRNDRPVRARYARSRSGRTDGDAYRIRGVIKEFPVWMNGHYCLLINFTSDIGRLHYEQVSLRMRSMLIR
jgi:hypothetical protein